MYSTYLFICGCAVSNYYIPTEDRRHRPSFVSLLLLMLLRFFFYILFVSLILIFYYSIRIDISLCFYFLFFSSFVPQSPPLRSFLTRNNKQHKTYNIEKEKEEEEEKEIRFTSTEDLFGRPTTVSRYLDWICRVASSYYYYF